MEEKERFKKPSKGLIVIIAIIIIIDLITSYTSSSIFEVIEYWIF